MSFFKKDKRRAQSDSITDDLIHELLAVGYFDVTEFVVTNKSDIGTWVNLVDSDSETIILSEYAAPGQGFALVGMQNVRTHTPLGVRCETAGADVRAFIAGLETVESVTA